MGDCFQEFSWVKHDPVRRLVSGVFQNIAERIRSGQEVFEKSLVGSGRLGSGRVASGSVTLARLYLREATQLLQGLDFFALLRVTEFKGAGRLGDRWAPLIGFHGTPRAPLACSRLFKRI